MVLQDKLQKLKFMQTIIKTREKLNQLLSQKTGQPIEVINRDTERDHWMTAQEALEYGLIDGILEKKA